MIAGEVDASDPNIIQEIIDQFAVEKIPAIAIAQKERLSALDFKGLQVESTLGKPPVLAINCIE